MPMHATTENDYSTYGQYNALLNPVTNPLLLNGHYSIDSPAITMHSKLAAALDTNTIRTLSSASTAVDSRQMLESTNCDLQSTQYN